MKHSAWQTFMGLLLLFIVCVVSWEAGSLAVIENHQADMEKEKPLVAIDPGHPTTSLGTENKVWVGTLDLREGDLASVLERMDEA